MHNTPASDKFLVDFGWHGVIISSVKIPYLVSLRCWQSLMVNQESRFIHFTDQRAARGRLLLIKL